MARVDRDRRYISWKGMALASVLLVALFCVSLYWVQADIAKLQAQDATLQLKVNVMEMNYADLQLELQRVGSEGYVENAARENYGFIRNGEIVFAFENPELLRGYTEEEYQTIMDEMRQNGFRCPGVGFKLAKNIVSLNSGQQVDGNRFCPIYLCLLFIPVIHTGFAAVFTGGFDHIAKGSKGFLCQHLHFDLLHSVLLIR